jgi:uncharacterized protein (DUF697 family)
MDNNNNNNIYYPTQPTKPELLRLKTYYWTDLLSVDSRIIIGFAIAYSIHFLGAFEKLEIYYIAIGFYILIRLWPFLVTNGKIRNRNKKMIDSYDKEVVEFEKSLNEYYFLKNRMEVERENRTRLEHQRRIESQRQSREKLEGQKRMEVERQKSLHLNKIKSLEVEKHYRLEIDRLKSLEVERENKLDLERQNEGGLEEQKKVEVEVHLKLEISRQKSLEVERQNKMDLERQKKPAILTPEEHSKVKFEKIKASWKSQPASNIKNSTIIKKIDNQLELEINNTIRNYSGYCAVLAIQPVPFADIFILTPIQILMGKKIASLRGYEIKENSIESILKEISSIIGMGILAQQLVIGAYKTFLPFLGGITTIPVVYGLSYGIGKTMDYYIIAKINGTQINKREIEKIFKSSREIGEREGKLKEKDIHANSRINGNKI